MSFDQIHAELQRLANPERALILQRFFKTGPGQYGEGDQFLGIKAPELRALARRYQATAEADVVRLLKSAWHEERIVALMILLHQFAKAEAMAQRRIYQLYLDSTAFINNWDLVDVSAPHIVGVYLHDKSRRPLYRLARSRSLWERRIAVLATFEFIRQRDFADALAIAKLLLEDREDLIHKAVGWMLREIGKRDLRAEETFLQEHYRRMPRTMLRYAIEKFPEARRRKYLDGKI
ncbi:MAG: DNA alkylation repair protein [Blastocatellia bacterium]